jgi:hypothetical protein
VQEALGTRFVPASNCLNFEKIPGSDPFRSQSGRFAADGSLVKASNGMASVRGLYRYLVKLKSDPASIDYTDQNTSVDFDIFSEGAVCVDKSSQKIVTGDINYAKGSLTCASNNSKLVQMPMYTSVTVKQLSNNNSPVINAANQNKVNFSVRMPLQEFQTKWNSECGTSSSPLLPVKYMVGKKAPQNISLNISKASIKNTITIIFNKQIDYRTINDVRVYRKGSSTNLNNMDNIMASLNYQFVETGNSLTVYPPIADTNKFTNNKYELDLSRLKGYDGKLIDSRYQKITFEY